MRKGISCLFGIIKVVFLFVIVLMLIINIMFITVSVMARDKVPSVFGYYPMIVLNDSMAPIIDNNDFVISKEVGVDELKKGDIISFYNDNNKVMVQRIVKVISLDGSISFKVKGDKGNGSSLVSADKVIGKYVFKIDVLASFILFLQTIPGVLIFIILPMVILVLNELFFMKLDKVGSSESF